MGASMGASMMHARRRGALFRRGPIPLLLGLLLATALPVLVAPLLLAPAWAQGAKCDYSGFENPCRVEDGEYRVLIPEGEDPFPAMVYLYGSGGRSVTIANHPVFEAAVGGRDYALIVPAAREMDYEGGRRDTGWALRSEPRAARDEVAFVRRVIEDAARRFRLDRERVLLAGQSRGGFLVWEIACHDPGLAAAYAVHAGSYLGELPAECDRPVRFLQTHGAADTVVPVAGKDDSAAWRRINPLPESLALMARTNGCGEPESGETERFLDFARKSWPACAPGSRLDLMVHPGGHGMPATWFRAVLDWFEEPLPETPELSPAVRRIGEGLPGAGSGGGRFKAPPAPGEKALGGD